MGTRARVKIGQCSAAKGSKSRNKVVVGEPAAGSLTLRSRQRVCVLVHSQDAEQAAECHGVADQHTRGLGGVVMGAGITLAWWIR